MSSEKDLGTLPHWDLSNIYPSLDSKDVDSAVEKLHESINQLGQFLETEEISRKGKIPSSLDRAAALVSEYLQRMNDILGYHPIMKF